MSVIWKKEFDMNKLQDKWIWIFIVFSLFQLWIIRLKNLLEYLKNLYFDKWKLFVVFLWVLFLFFIYNKSIYINWYKITTLYDLEKYYYENNSKFRNLVNKVNNFFIEDNQINFYNWIYWFITK